MARKQDRWDIVIRLVAMIPHAFVIGILLSACGTPTMTVYYRSVATALDTGKACYRVVRGVDSARRTQYQSLRMTGDETGAELLRSKWLGKDYPAAIRACDAIGALGEEALAAGPVIEKGANKDKDANDWIAKLIGLGLETVRILKGLGIEFNPGGQ